MWDQFGISGKLKNTQYEFDNPSDANRKIRVFSDAPHLIKCIINRLMTHDLKVTKILVNYNFLTFHKFYIKKLIKNRLKIIMSSGNIIRLYIMKIVNMI